MGAIDIADVLGVAIGYLIAATVRYLSRSRFWTKVSKRAQHYLDDPRVPISTPGEAAEQALIAEQRHSVVRIARKLSRSIPPENVDKSAVPNKLGDHDDTPKLPIKS